MSDNFGVIEFEWDIDPSDTALLVIDMQSGFLDLDSTFGKAGLTKNQRAIIPNVCGLVEACRESGMPRVTVVTVVPRASRSRCCSLRSSASRAWAYRGRRW